jgi:hypothetical protein
MRGLKTERRPGTLIAVVAVPKKKPSAADAVHT